MKLIYILLIILLLLMSCASIKSITPEEALNAHTKLHSVDGYIVFHPLVVVEVSENCIAAKSFLLPNYNRPFLVTIRAPFIGSPGSMVVEDGWRLSNLGGSTGTAAALGALIAGTGGRLLLGKEDIDDTLGKKTICKPGLYRMDITDKGVRFIPLLQYIPKDTE
jgi:hypothetical protein